MSIYPCDAHGSRVPGSLETAYPSILDSGARVSRRLRLCAEHMDRFLSQYGSRWTDANATDEVPSREVCSSCGSEEALDSGNAAIFCTVFRRGQERRDYFGPLCKPCSATIELALGLQP